MSGLMRALPRLFGRACDLMRRSLGDYRWPLSLIAHLTWVAARVAVGRRVPGLRWKPHQETRLDLPVGPLWLGEDSAEVDLITFWETFLTPSWPVPYERFAESFVLDIGAHRGYFGAFALQHGAYEVWSYEPHPELFATLHRAASGMRLPGRRWRALETAVGATRREAELHLSTESWSHSLHRPSRGKIVGTLPVPVLPFSEIMDEVRVPGTPHILVKLNIEGAAGEVVIGTPKDAWAAVEDVLLDYEQTTPEPFEDIAEHLAEAGLHLRASRRHSHWFTRMEP